LAGVTAPPLTSGPPGTMVAGATGNDLFLMVVAANDG
jgi:hypothetical protein